jgi:hypothetical protein
MPPRCFPVPAYLAVIAVTLTGEIDHRPSPPRLQLHLPCTCQNLADRREIVIVTAVVRIIGIKDLSILREADIFPGGKSGGNAGIRGMQVENSFLLLTSTWIPLKPGFLFTGEAVQIAKGR